MNVCSTVCRSRPPVRFHWLRAAALTTSALFAWSFALAVPTQALSHQPAYKRNGVRSLSAAEMAKIVGGAAVSPAPGSPYPWQSSVAGVNTANGDKLTRLPVVSWPVRGGRLSVDFALIHNSQSARNAEVGYKWNTSFDLYASVDGSGNFTAHWGDDRSYTFTKNMDGSFSPPTGIHDSLVKNGDSTYTLTKPDQTHYHYTTALLCDTIKDENGNSITLAYNASNQVSTITDVTSRAITLSYTGGQLTGITDPLSRSWTISYDGSGNLKALSYPLLNGTTYSTNLLYNANHDITDLQTPRGYHYTFNYNADDSLAWAKDPAGNQTSFSYTATTTTITDPNSNATMHTYDGNGRITQVEDPLLDHENYTYDTSNNKTQVTDKNGYASNFTFDGNGNVLTAQDPYTNTTTYTYNSHNYMLTKTVPTGEETVNTYDTHDNLTGVTYKDNTGATKATISYTVNSYGQRTDYYDANNHHYTYGYDINGDLTSQTTPLSNQYGWTFDAVGSLKTRLVPSSAPPGTPFGMRLRHRRGQVCGSSSISYTVDNWERVTTITYPNSTTKTFQYDADNNLTQFTDVTGTTTRTYDSDDRLTNESHGGSTVVSYSYDGVGQKGLLSSTTDANSRTISYSYTVRNELSQVTDSSLTGSTSYSYDADGNETGITNPNSTTVTETYDHADRLTGVYNKTGGGTTLSSFVYGYDTDSRRNSVTELDNSQVSYTYDWGGRLLTDNRTGTNAYTRSYVLDGVGNRTSQTVNGTSTTFTYDVDDELKSTSGGFTNSYSYDVSGNQTGRTVGGVSYTLAYDYDNELTSITQGSATTTFQYDAQGRRASRTAGGVTTSFLYDGDKVLLEKQGSTTTATYTYGNALIRKDGEYPLFDGLGSERTVTNSSQTVTGTITYEGFGQTVATTGSSTDPYMFGATSRYRNDGDAGLMQVGARYYDAQVGRFITRDTDLSQHPYIYCDSDPVNSLDPSGHSPGAYNPHQNDPRPAPAPVFDFDFNHDDWQQIAKGIEQIGNWEMDLGVPILVPGAIGAGSPNPGQIVPDIPIKWHLPGFPAPAEGAPIAKGGGIAGAIGGGITLGGWIAKHVIAPLVRLL